jgi:inner membrane transporter RhtA
MIAAQPKPLQSAALVGVVAALASQVSMNLGAGFAKQLFPLVGAYGVTALRISLAALMLLALHRPWRSPLPRALIPALVVYGAMLGLMNLFYYQALARLPIGIATGIEVMGPLAVVLAASRRARDYAWLGLAIIGLLLLLPLHAGSKLSLTGILFGLGAAACWALYIIYGKRVSEPLGSNAVAWGMLVSSLLTLPIGVASSGMALFSPSLLIVGAGIALLSSAIPYSLEMQAMRRLPASVFGMLLGACPAVGALVGYLVLDEMLTLTQWVAIGCIIGAATGSSLGGSKEKEPRLAS